MRRPRGRPDAARRVREVTDPASDASPRPSDATDALSFASDAPSDATDSLPLAADAPSDAADRLSFAHRRAIGRESWQHEAPDRPTKPDRRPLLRDRCRPRDHRCLIGRDPSAIARDPSPTIPARCTGHSDRTLSVRSRPPSGLVPSPVSSPLRPLPLRPLPPWSAGRAGAG